MNILQKLVTFSFLAIMPVFAAEDPGEDLFYGEKENLEKFLETAQILQNLDQTFTTELQKQEYTLTHNLGKLWQDIITLLEAYNKDPHQTCSQHRNEFMNKTMNRTAMEERVKTSQYTEQISNFAQSVLDFQKIYGPVREAISQRMEEERIALLKGEFESQSPKEIFQKSFLDFDLIKLEEKFSEILNTLQTSLNKPIAYSQKCLTCSLELLTVSSPKATSFAEQRLFFFDSLQKLSENNLRQSCLVLSKVQFLIYHNLTQQGHTLLKPVFEPYGIDIIPYVPESDRKIFIYKDREHNHFMIPVQIGDHLFSCMLDTGATYLSFTKTDAKRIGIDLNALRYTLTVNTATGSDNAARHELKEIKIGDLRLKQVSAIIMENGEHSVLGMSALKRTNVTISGDTVTLTLPNKPKDT